MRTFLRSGIVGLALAGAGLMLPSEAAACGGFFCNRAQPINQAAEGIIFADNGDGTVTAVIQIKYQGPSKNFSWLLPISSVPSSDQLEVASDLAFQRLQSATNPNYTLTTRVEGTCRQDQFGGGGPVFGAAGASASGGASGVSLPPSVQVEAMGVVGAFEYTVISIDKSSPNAADTAVTWLTDNGYDVPSSAPALLGPYLEEGMYLLALRLTKGADTGSIRPIVITYKGTPSIPIKLTAVAANEDMGVLTWVLGKSRSVPMNYLSLELNEARINWFNPALNYNSVVIDAANDAGGHGFVTEFSGSTSTLASQIWTRFDEQQWTSFKSSVFSSFSDFFSRANQQYGQWAGFWDATRAAVTLPAKVSFEDFKLCPDCYAEQLSFMPADYVAALEQDVIQPVKRVQQLVDAHPQMTRLYSTLSADEMTIDPLFGFNAKLPEVSNQHTAERVIECNASVSQFQAPWRIELPQGGVIRGTAAAANPQTWPAGLDALPPNRVITQTAETGSGKVIEDNSAGIKTLLTAYNASIPAGGAGGSSGAGSSGAASGGAASSGAGGAAVGKGGEASGKGGEAGDTESSVSAVGGGCGMSRKRDASGLVFAAAALGVVTLRRRRR